MKQMKTMNAVIVEVGAEVAVVVTELNRNEQGRTAVALHREELVELLEEQRRFRKQVVVG